MTEKGRRSKAGKTNKGGARLFLPVTVLALVMALAFRPGTALAQCEQVASATNMASTVSSNDMTYIGEFRTTLLEFMGADVPTAQDEMETRYTEFDVNIRTWLGDWWQNRYLPAMQAMTRQINSHMVAQTTEIGMLMDGQNLNRTIDRLQREELSSWRRFNPSLRQCVMDTTTMQLPTARTAALSLAAPLGREIANWQTAKTGTSLGDGLPVAALRERVDMYRDYFCDRRSNGGIGVCRDFDGRFPGGDVRLPEFLWGHEMTVNPADADRRLALRQGMVNIMQPFVFDPLTPTELSQPGADAKTMARRAHFARQQAALHVIASIAATRVQMQDGSNPAAGLAPGSTGATWPMIRDFRRRAGVHDNQAARVPSYNEAMRAQMQEQYWSPQYALSLVESPENLGREQAMLKSRQLMQGNDLYRRLEEVTALLAAEYAFELDQHRYELAPR